MVCALASGIEAGSGMQIELQKGLPRRLGRLLSFCLAISLAPTAPAADQIEELARRAGMQILEKGDSSKAVEKVAAAEFPMRSLSAENRTRAEEVIKRCTQFRRLPKLQYAIDQPIYRYLLQHPDVAVSTWRVMGISSFQMFQTGPLEYEASASDGSEGISDILYRDENQIIFICEGSYRNILLPAPLEASALIWFRTDYKPHADGTHLVTQSTDVFVHFPSAGVAGVAKVLTPVTNNLMDRNLFEVSLYAAIMSRAVRDEPEWVVELSEDLEGVLPQRRTELAAIAKQARPATTQPRSLRYIDRSLLEPAQPAASTTADPDVAQPLLRPRQISTNPALKPVRTATQQ
jgi:hypothetical protein